MLKNSSVKTISQPEFLDIVPKNDLISECTIKVLYVGENRNHSFISKDAARKIAATLPGAPIVARYIPKKDDFGDHEMHMVIKNGKIEVEKGTVPYGFVSPSGEVWFQEFLDTSADGKRTTREYLMTKGYLWTGRYPEVRRAIDEGLPQSMELENESLDSKWAIDNNSGYDFLIINDAKIEGLCILGSDVEPCFEGAAVYKDDGKAVAAMPKNDVTTVSFTDASFLEDLVSMRDQLMFTLNKTDNNEGGLEMPKNAENVEELELKAGNIAFEESAGGEGDGTTDSAGESEGGVDAGGSDNTEEGENEAPESSEAADPAEDEVEEPAEPSFDDLTVDETLDLINGVSLTEEDKRKIEQAGRADFDYHDESAEDKVEVITKTTEFIPAGEEEGDKIVETTVKTEQQCRVNDEQYIEPEIPQPETAVYNAAEQSKADFEAAFTKLQGEHENLKTAYAAKVSELEGVIAAKDAEIANLTAFKANIEMQEKDAEIAKYFMLSDEDKADVIANKSVYTLDEIKSKLAVLYVEKNVSFEALEPEAVEAPAVEAERSPITTFSLDAPADVEFASAVPGFVQALMDMNRN